MLPLLSVKQLCRSGWPTEAEARCVVICGVFIYYCTSVCGHAVYVYFCCFGFLLLMFSLADQQLLVGGGVRVGK